MIMLPGKETTTQILHHNYDEVTHMTTYSIGSMTERSDPLVVLVPGIRFQANSSSSFQFGFTGVYFEDEFLPVPIPMIQWFKRI